MPFFLKDRSTILRNYILRWWLGWWGVEVFADIKAISAQISWRLDGWPGLSLATNETKQTDKATCWCSSAPQKQA